MLKAAVEGKPRPPDRAFRDRFARELGLSREQQERIDSVMGHDPLGIARPTAGAP
jgi:hypothetical protein